MPFVPFLLVAFSNNQNEEKNAVRCLLTQSTYMMKLLLLTLQNTPQTLCTLFLNYYHIPLQRYYRIRALSILIELFLRNLQVKLAI